MSVKAQILILLSGRDQWLPCHKEDTERLLCALPKCEVREFVNNGQFIFLEDGVDLATILKIAYYYRVYQIANRGCFSSLYLNFRQQYSRKNTWRIPSKGPFLYVGNHIFIDLELRPAAIHFSKKRNIIFRGLSHHVVFAKKIVSKLSDIQTFLTVRIIGIVPVCNINFYKLVLSTTHVVMYPGDICEALHIKVVNSFRFLHVWL
ncbi:hypothetical protein Bca4012_027364 [Brassica carinata]